MTAESFDTGIARQIGHYADAVRVPAGHDQILVSGTPGLAPDGSLPGDMTGQTTQAWHNIQTPLGQAGASLSDIVSVRPWLPAQRTSGPTSKSGASSSPISRPPCSG